MSANETAAAVTSESEKRMAALQSERDTLFREMDQVLSARHRPASQRLEGLAQLFLDANHRTATLIGTSLLNLADEIRS